MINFQEYRETKLAVIRAQLDDVDGTIEYAQENGLPVTKADREECIAIWKEKERRLLDLMENYPNVVTHEEFIAFREMKEFQQKTGTED